MQDMSHPLPSHEKIREPMVIRRVLAFIDQERETKVAALDVEVAVPKVAGFQAREAEPRPIRCYQAELVVPKVDAFNAKETRPKVATHFYEVSVPKVVALFAKEESDFDSAAAEWKK